MLTLRKSLLAFCKLMRYGRHLSIPAFTERLSSMNTIHAPALASEVRQTVRREAGGRHCAAARRMRPFAVSFFRMPARPADDHQDSKGTHDVISSGKARWFGLAVLLAVQFMVVLDIAIVNVALPSIQTDLGFSQENLQWVISAYALVFGGFLLLGGRMADLVGRRRIFLLGLVVFSVGSLLCGLAWSEASLIGFRALQGLGAAIITPAALSILTTTFQEGRERNIALGAWGASAASAPPQASCWAASSPTPSRGRGSSSSTCRSACSPSS